MGEEINKLKAKEIVDYLGSLFTNPKCFLNYNKDYELLIAVMLSAQTTDVSVNKATETLFKEFDSLNKLANADIKEIEKHIKFLGLYKNKSKNIIEISKTLLNNYNGIVPNDKNELVKLPGVGNKTANVVLVELFKKQEFPVDTHINRIAKRLGIAWENDDILTVEKKLKDFFKDFDFIRLHHQIILFGRNICSAKKPRCDECKISKLCEFYKKIK